MNIGALFIFAAMLAIGQVLFKKVGLGIRGLSAGEAVFAALGNPVLYWALALYGMATALWIWILSRVPLSHAYPWVAVGAAIVPMLGWCFFGERTGPVFWVGVGFIVLGILLVQSSGRVL